MQSLFSTQENKSVVKNVSDMLAHEWYLNTFHLNSVVNNLLNSFATEIGDEERDEFNTTKQLYLDALTIVYAPAHTILGRACELTTLSSYSNAGISNETQSCTSDKEGQTDPEIDVIENLQRDKDFLAERVRHLQEERENAEKFQAETRVQLTRIKLSQEHVRIKELEDEVLKLRIENARLTEMANQSESTRSGSESSGSSTNTQIVTAPHKLYTIFRTNSNLPNLTIPMYTVPWKRTRFTNIMFERYKEERGLKEISDFSNFDCQGRLFSGIYKVMQVDRSLTQRVLDDILKDIN